MQFLAHNKPTAEYGSPAPADHPEYNLTSEDHTQISAAMSAASGEAARLPELRLLMSFGQQRKLIRVAAVTGNPGTFQVFADDFLMGTITKRGRNEYSWSGREMTPAHLLHIKDAMRVQWGFEV